MVHACINAHYVYMYARWRVFVCLEQYTGSDSVVVVCRAMNTPAEQAYADFFDFSYPGETQPCPEVIQPYTGTLSKHYAACGVASVPLPSDLHSALPMSDVTRAIQDTFQDLRSSSFASAEAEKQTWMWLIPPGEHPSIKAVVANVVHMSNLITDQPIYESALGDSDNVSRVAYTQLWLQRFLLHIGYEMNNARTAVLMRFSAPYASSLFLFKDQRITEAGAKHTTAAKAMLDHTMDHIHTLQQCQMDNMFRVQQQQHPHQSLKRSRAPSLVVQDRRLENIVVKSNLAFPLNMDLLREKCRGYIKFHDRFDGAVITHPNTSPMKFLAFSSGAVMCVGGKHYDLARDALLQMMDIFYECRDTGQSHGGNKSHELTTTSVLSASGGIKSARQNDGRDRHRRNG